MRFSKSLILLFFLMISSFPIFAQNIPDSITRARRDAPEDFLVGIGIAKAETDWDSMTLAETLARVDLARSFSQAVQSIIRDYSASSEVSDDSLYFREEIVVSITAAHIKDSWIAALEKTSDGTWWCAVYWDKTDYVREINQAQAAARLAVPAFLLQRAEDRMNDAFERASEDKEE
jgi:hypothetical protein